jgi:hypothetical protein
MGYLGAVLIPRPGIDSPNYCERDSGYGEGHRGMFNDSRCVRGT